MPQTPRTFAKQQLLVTMASSYIFDAPIANYIFVYYIAHFFCGRLFFVANGARKMSNRYAEIL